MASPAANHTRAVSLGPNRFKQDYYFDHSQLTHPYGSTRLLSVDDEPMVLVTRRAILEISGFEVLNAASGREALQSIARQHIDLAIIDYRMPDVDGGVLARELKRLRPLLPIIMVSGGQVDEESRACVDRFLTKAQSPVRLLREIERVLGSSRLPLSVAPGF
jgi:CheY-like chemotaxis protein